MIGTGDPGIIEVIVMIAMIAMIAMNVMTVMIEVIDIGAEGVTAETIKEEAGEDPEAQGKAPRTTIVLLELI